MQVVEDLLVKAKAACLVRVIDLHGLFRPAVTVAARFAIDVFASLGEEALHEAIERPVFDDDGWVSSQRPEHPALLG